MKKLIGLFKNRTFIQGISAIISNIHLGNFLKGKIYTGNTKYACLPGFNCYSCPGAAASCPIGSLQAVLGGKKYKFSFYIVGILMFIGVLLGRLVCGFLCIFGWIQDLLYKIPTPKIKVPEKIDKPLRWFKYMILIVMVILLPMFLKNDFGIAPPYFCKWICPSGTLIGGIPLIIKNPTLRSMLGFLFNWKMFILIVTLVSSVFIYRPFCKYICPLGAIYGLFNKFSFYKMSVDMNKCTGCKMCEKKCKMNVAVTKNINSLECIRCLECKKVCKVGAISSGFNIKPEKQAENIENGKKDTGENFSCRG